MATYVLDAVPCAIHLVLPSVRIVLDLHVLNRELKRSKYIPQVDMMAYLLKTISNLKRIHAKVAHTHVNSIPIRKPNVGTPVVWVNVSHHVQQHAQHPV